MSHPRRRGVAGAAAAVSVLVVVLLLGPQLGLWGGPPGPDTNFPVQLVVGGVNGSLLSGFFGVNVHVVGVGASGLAGWVNHTPFTFFRFTPLGEATDQVRSVSYTQSGVPSPVHGQTDSEFVAWCNWLHCRAALMVPAEINNVSIAVATVKYVEQNLSFHPAFWAIGNEPQQWVHFGVPWKSWQPTDDFTATPLQYAREVQQYVKAIRAYDPSVHFIGIESVVGGSMSAGWLKPLVQIDGPNITAVAYHAYPGGNASAAPLPANLYATLTSPGSFPLNYPTTVGIVRSACRTCNITVFVDEFNAALGGNYTQLMTSYTEAVYLTAAMIEAIHLGVARIDFFDLEDFDGTLPYGLMTIGGGNRPGAAVFSMIFRNVSSGAVLNATLRGAPGLVYSLLTENGSRASFLVVNANVTATLSLSLAGSTLGVPRSGGAALSWTPREAVPVLTSYMSNAWPLVWTIPPQSILLLDTG